PFALDEDAEPLRNRPRLRAAVNASWIPADDWTLSAFGGWTGTRFDSSIPTAGRWLPGYPVVDIALVHRVMRRSITLAIDNLLDRHYKSAIGFPGERRR